MGKLLDHFLGPKYVSCIYLEQGLNIYKDSFTHCCVPHSNGNGCVGIGKFHGDELPMEFIMDARRRLIDDNQNGNNSPCNGCRFLTKKRWRTKYPLRYVTINDFYACNLRCEYCFTRYATEHMKLKKSHDTFLLFKDIVANGYLSPAAMVFWGGGEVTVYKHFEPIAKLMLANNITQFVNTNAVRYSETIEQGLRRKKMIVQVSVDSGTRETYHAVKGRDAHEAVWANVARYAAAGDLQVKYIIKHNNSGPEDVMGFISLCKKAGVREIVVMPEMGELNRQAISEETLQAAATMVHEAIKANMVVNEDFSDFGETYPPIIRGKLDALLASNGKSAQVLRAERFLRKLIRFVKHVRRYCQASYLVLKNRIRWGLSPKTSAN